MDLSIGELLKGIFTTLLENITLTPLIMKNCNTNVRIKLLSFFFLVTLHIFIIMLFFYSIILQNLIATF